VGVGFCGVLREDIGIGDVVIPVAAARDEDTTDHYVDKKVPAVADFELISKLIEVARRYKLKVHVGSIVTTSSPFSEDVEWVRKWSSYGVLAVKCETSVLYLLSYLNNIPVAAILTVSDNVVKKEMYWMKPEVEKAMVETYDKVIKVALDILTEIVYSEKHGLYR
jgi:AMP nucleosidase